MPPRRARLVAIAAGVTLALAFPDPGWSPLAWIALPAFLATLLPGPIATRAALRRGLTLGALFGLGFFGVLLYWISIVGYVAYAALLVVQIAYLMLFGAVTAILLLKPTKVVAVAGPAVAWVAIEYLRALFPVGGFTWGQLAQSQATLPWMLRPAGLAGGWAVSLLLVVAASLVLMAWRRRREGGRRVGAPLAAALVLLGVPALMPAPRAHGAAVNVAIVQGGVPRDFPGSGFEKDLEILASHERLTTRLAEDAPDLVVWPESAVGIDPFLVPDVAASIARAARSVGASMLVGANLEANGGERYQVTILEVDASGAITDVYAKTRLVPFGEYVPFRWALGWIPMLDQVPRDAVPGEEHKVFDVAGGKVGTVISYEGDFGAIARHPMALGARLLVVATNTSTWGETPASAQHLAFSRVRAVENGAWVVHAAISGTSGFVAPDGTVHDRTALWTEAAPVRTLRFAERPTLYTRFGDWLPILCLGATAVWLGRAFRRRRGDMGS